jgi:hypothetical protein
MGLMAEPRTISVRRGEDDLTSATERTSVRLINRSRHSITVKDISTSCNCTVVSGPARRTIAAGATAEISVESELPQLGKQVSYVTITTDAPETPLLTIRLELQGRQLMAPRILQMPRDLYVRVDPGSRCDLPALEGPP